MFIHKSLDITQKLEVLSQDAQYDLACSCATSEDEHRRRSSDNKWIYPVTWASGKKTFLFKTLLSNICSNNCLYCPLRKTQDRALRLNLEPFEIAKTFFQLLSKKRVSGLFLSSGVLGTADRTMEKINSSAQIIRQSGFRGYVHLKVIPGSSENAIRKALSLATAVSVNIEVPRSEDFNLIAQDKDFSKDVLKSISYISSLRLQLPPSRRPHQTTQFIVGASNETDSEIISQAGYLYKQLKLNRIYFSSYQRGSGDKSIPGEKSLVTNEQMLLREHRLYQSDWLIRKYGFDPSEIVFEKDGNLSLEYDPKEDWARKHPEFFPVNINKADELSLLRVPGLGDISVQRIIQIRKNKSRITSLSMIGKTGKRLKKAEKYICF